MNVPESPSRKKSQKKVSTAARYATDQSSCRPAQDDVFRNQSVETAVVLSVLTLSNEAWVSTSAGV